MGQFDNKVVIITGSSAGIGQDAAVEFAKEGASVTIHGQNQDRLNQTIDLLRQNNVPESKYLAVIGSMQDDETPKKIIDSTVEKFGKIDVLINNAGAISKPNTDNDSLENFDFLFTVNLRSVVALTQLAIPHLTKTKGNIVNVSSAGAVRAFPAATFYTMTKAALDHYTKNCSLKYGHLGIRVNSLNPGPVETIIFTRHNPPNEIQQKHAEWIQKTTALQRSGQVSEMSTILKFLASEQASYVTGASWLADGGHSVYTTPVEFH